MHAFIQERQLRASSVEDGNITREKLVKLTTSLQELREQARDASASMEHDAEQHAEVEEAMGKVREELISKRRRVHQLVAKVDCLELNQVPWPLRVIGSQSRSLAVSGGYPIPET
eukprot:1765981-Rhodomonas_salina.4